LREGGLTSAGAATAALPFGQPSVTIPPVWPPGGFWSQTGNFPVALDGCIKPTGNCPELKIGIVSDAQEAPPNLPAPNCGYAVGKEVANKEVCPACRERKEAHETKRREEAVRLAEPFIQEAKRKAAEAAEHKAAEEAQCKAEQTYEYMKKQYRIAEAPAKTSCRPWDPVAQLIQSCHRLGQQEGGACFKGRCHCLLPQWITTRLDCDGTFVQQSNHGDPDEE
jgi:hypothetical protein